MNNTCKVIWSHVLQQMVVVSEKVSSVGKAQSTRASCGTPGGPGATQRAELSGPGNLALLATAVALVGGVAWPAQAQGLPSNSLPTGGSVAAGQASIRSSGAQMVIDQASQRAAINWQSFNVGAGAQVHFNQPSASASTLNRVTGPEASTILGRITAPGQVIISNGNGVFFGRGSRVDVGSLVATTHGTDTERFMAGALLFERQNSKGSVVNEGELRAKIEGYIALLAPEVRNHGLIVATKGTVALAAGEVIELQIDPQNKLANIRVQPGQWQALVENRQAIEAEGGLVILSAMAAREVMGGVVKNSGSINANGLQRQGGRILLSASHRVENTGTLTANATAGAVEGGPAGKVSLAAPEVVNTGSISATGASQHSAGSISVQATNFTQGASGHLDVSAPLQGGQVSLQATGKVQLQGAVNASATQDSTAAAAPTQGGDVSITAQGDVELSDAVLDASGGQGGRISVRAAADAQPDHPQPLPDVPGQGRLAIMGHSTLSTRGRSGKGGHTTLLGDRIGLLDDTSIDATGTNGGGNVLVGGDWQGSNGVYQATRVYMGQGVSIDASAIEQGDGGKIVLWSDIANANSVTAAHGSLVSKGGRLGGDGGQIETSGHLLDIQGAEVNTLAPLGKTGDWLLDPGNINITSANGWEVGESQITWPTFESGAPYTGDTWTVIHPNAVAYALARSNLTITTGGSGYQLQVNSPITASGYGSLTLNAPGGAISIYSAISIAGSLYVNATNIVITAGLATSGYGQQIYVAAVNNIDLANTVNANTYNGNVSFIADSDANSSGNFWQGGLIVNPGSGNVLLRAHYFPPEVSVVNGSGTLTVEPSAASFYDALGTSWFTPAATLTGLSIGKATNTLNVSVNAPLSIAGPISLQGNWVIIEHNITSTATGDLYFFGNALFHNNPGWSVDFYSGKTITKTAGTGTLTMAGNGRINNGPHVGSIQATGSGKLNVVMIGEMDGGTTFGVSTGIISTNGGHVWIGGGPKTATWNGLSVGTTASYGGYGGNAHGLDLNNITTNGGDVLLAAHTANNSYGDIGTIASSATINAGTGNITLLTNKSDYYGTINVNTTGKLTLAPISGKDSGLTNLSFGGSQGAADFTGSNDAAGLVIKNMASLGGLSLGTYQGTGRGGDTAYGLQNTKDTYLLNSISINGPVMLYGSLVDVAANITTNNKDIFLQGSGTGTQTGIRLSTAYSGTLSSGSGNITLQSDVIAFDGLISSANTGRTTTINSTGVLTLRPNSYAFSANALSGSNGGSGTTLDWTGAFSGTTWEITKAQNAEADFPGLRINNFTNLGGLVLQKEWVSTGVNLRSSLQGTGGISVYGGNIAVSSSITTNNLSLTSYGSVTQTAALTLANLSLKGSGSFALNHASNSMSTLAAGSGIYDRVGTLSLTNAGALTIGSVAGTASVNAASGIWSSGTVFVNTASGNLTLAQNVDTSNASGAAIRLAAGTNASRGGAGTPATGNVVISGSRALAAGSGGKIAIYSGDISGSTGLTALVGSGSGRFRYNTSINAAGTETAGYTTALSSNAVHAIYREDRTVAGTVDNKSITYGDAYTLTGANITGTVNGDTPSFTVESALKATSGNIRVGTYNVNASSLAGLGYSGTIGKGTLTIAAKALTLTGFTPANRVYDGTTTATFTAANLALTGKVGIDSISITQTGATFADKHVGTGKTVTLKGIALSSGNINSDAGNYTLAGTVTNTANITALPITLTAAAQSKTYGNADPALTHTGSIALKTGDSYTGALSRAAGQDFGTYAITQGTLAINDGNSGNNYTVTYAGNNLSISKRAITLTATAVSKTYGNADPTLAVSVTTGSLASVAGGHTGNDTLAEVAGTLSRQAGENVGSYDVALGTAGTAGSKAGNYTVTFSADNNALTIAQRAITLTATPVSKTYGNADPTLAVSISSGSLASLAGVTSGQAGNDTLADVTGTLTRSVADTGLQNVGSYDVALGSGTRAANYSISFVTNNNALTVNKRPITLTATPATKVYGAADPTLAVTVTDGSLATVAVTDTLAQVTGTLSRAAGSNVGNYHVSLGSGSKVGNYEVSFVDTNNAFSITPKTVSLSASKVYDGTTALGSTQVTLSTGVGGESLTFTGAVASDTHVTTVGKYISAITLADGTGGLATNYQLPATLDRTTAPVTITPATLTATLNNNSVTKVYDGTTSAPAGFTPSWTLTGFVSGDTAATFSTTGMAYNDANVASATGVTVSGLGIVSITGTVSSKATDYALDSTSKSVTAAITPAPLTVNVNNDARFVAAGPDTTGYAGVSVTGFVNGQTTATAAGYTAPTVTRTTERPDNATTGDNTQAGIYTGQLTATGGSASNYSFATYTAGTYTIVPSNQLLVKATVVSDFYGTATSYGISSASYWDPTVSEGFPSGKEVPLTPTVNGSNGFTVADGAAGAATFTLAPITTATSFSSAGKLKVGSYQLSATNISKATDQNFSSTLTIVGSHQVTTKALTASATGVSKVYDGTTLITHGTLGLATKEQSATPVVDDVSLASGAIGVYTAGKNAGTDLAFSYSNLRLTGNDASNYHLSGGSGLVVAVGASGGVIQAKEITSLSATKVYDGTTTLSGSQVTMAGLVDGESLNYTAAASNAHVATVGKTIASFTAANGANSELASNYAFPAALLTGSTVTITPATLTPTLSNSGVTKVYTGTDNAPGSFAPTWTFSGLVSGDTGATLASTASAYNTVNVATANKVTVSGLTIASVAGNKGSQATDYALDATSKLVAASITKAPLTATATDQTRVYGDNNPAFTQTYTGFVNSETETVLTGTPAASTTATTTSNVGSYAIVNSIGTLAASNYSIALANGSLSVTARPVAVSTDAGQGKIYGNADTALTYTVAADGVSGSRGLANGETLSGGLSRAAGEVVGTYAISQNTLTTANNPNYTVTWAGANYTVSQRPITLTAAAVTRVYGETDPAVSVSITSGSLGSVTVGDTLADVTGTLSREAGNNVGNYDVLLGSGTKVSNYDVTFATDNNAFSITRKTVTLSASKVYDGSSSLDGFVTLATGVGSETLTYSNATAFSKHAGDASNHISAITLGNATDGSGGLAANYQAPLTPSAANAPVTITAKTLSPTLSNAEVSKVYDGTTASGSFTPVWTFSGLVDGDTSAALSSASTIFNDATVAGASALVITGLSITGVTGNKGSLPGDYVLDVSNKSVAGSITKAPLTVTASDQTRLYGDANPDFTQTIAGYVAGENAGNVTITGAATATATALTSSGVGTYGISASTGTLSADNYQFVPVDGALTITPRPIAVSANAGQSKVYGDADPVLTYTVAANTGPTSRGLVEGDTLSGSLVRATGENVGSSYTLGQGSLDDQANPNYSFSWTGATFAISARPITLSANAVSKIYGEVNPGLSVSVTAGSLGSVAVSDTLADVTGTLSRQVGNNVGSYNVALGSGSQASNYTITYATNNQAFSITPKTVSLSASKVYDGTLDLTGKVEIVTGVAGESLNYTAALANDAHVATTDKYVAAITLTTGANGELASNYQLPATLDKTTAPLSITAKTLTPALSNAQVTKAYDGTANAPGGFAPSWTFAGLLSGDTQATLTATTASYNNANVASANALTVSGLAIASVTGNNGSRASDYVLDGTSKTTGAGVASISKAALTVAVNNDARFAAQADAVGFAGVSHSGLVNGETAAVLGGALALTRSNAGINAAGTYSGVLQASGLTAANYSIGYVNGDYSIVGANQLLVRVNNLSSTYGASQPYSVAAVEYSDGVNVIRLDNGSVARSSVTINSTNQVVVNDGANGLASFTLAPVSGLQSGAGKLSVGTWQVGTSGTVTENSLKFSNTVTVVGNHQVMPKAVTASATGVTKVYDGHQAVTSANFALDGTVSGDVLGASGTGTFSTKNVGSSLGYSFANVSLSGADAGNYYLSGGNSFAGSNGSITPKAVSLSASKTYDGTTTLSGNQVTISGTVNGETLTYTGATASDAHVATPAKYVSALTLAHAVDGSGGLAGNYLLPTLNAMNAPLTISARSLTASLNNTGVSKVYDGTTSAPDGFVASYIFTGLASGDTDASLAHASALYNNANVATANALALSGLRIGGVTGTNGSAASDYVLASTNGSVAATISRADLTVQAGNDAKFAGQADSTTGFAGVSYRGFVNGETSSVLGGTLAITRQNAATDNTAGSTYTGVLQASGLTAANYNLTYLNGDFSIAGSNQLVVRVAPASTAYGATTPYAVTSAQYESGGTVYSLGSGGVTGSSVSVSASNEVSINDGSSGTANFTLAPLAAVRSTGNHLSVGAYQVGTSGEVSVTSINFNQFVTVLGRHQVNPKAVTASASDVSKTYDGNRAITQGFLSVSGKELGDTLSVAGLGAYTAKHAGTTAYDYTNVALSGADAGNYVLAGGNSLSGSNGSILAKTVTATYIASSKVYDSSRSAQVFGISSDFVANDQVGLQHAQAAFDTKNVGGSKTVTVSGIAINGADSGNYALQSTTASASASIAAKAITITGITAANKVYDGSTQAVVTAPNAPGWIAGDDVSVSISGVLVDKHVGRGKSVTLISQYTGSDVGNYTITDQASTTADVAIKEVSLNLTSISKVYDGQTAYNANAGELQTLSNQLGVSGDAITSALLTYDTKNVGTGKDVSLQSVMLSDGNGGNNYAVTLGSNSASSITRLSSVTWTGGASGNWFDANNWAGGAVPDLSNVANVVIPSGVNVSFDTTGAVSPADTSAAVNLVGLGTQGSLTQADGTLNIGAGGMTLGGYSQSGGTLTNAGTTQLGSYAQSGGSFSGTGSITAGSLTQTGGTLAAGANLTVSQAFSQSGAGTITVAGSTRITDTSSGVQLGNLSSTGGLSVSSTGGAITQADGTALAVGGTADFSASTGTDPSGPADITLVQANDFKGLVNASGQDVTLNDLNGLTLGKVDASGLLRVKAGNDLVVTGAVDATILSLESAQGAIQQLAGSEISVPGQVDLKAAGSITLDQANDFGGMVEVQGGTDVSLQDRNSMTLGHVTASGLLKVTVDQTLTLDGVVTSGSLALTSAEGNLLQSGNSAIKVDGISTLEAGGHIMLAQANDFKGLVNATGHNITLNDINDLTLGQVVATGLLKVTAGQDVALSGAISVDALQVTTAGEISQPTGVVTVLTGPTQLTAGEGITLAQANDFRGVVDASGKDLTLNNVTDLVLGKVDAQGLLKVTVAQDVALNGAVSAQSLQLTADGDINQTAGTLNVLTGPAQLSAGGDIALAQANDFKGVVTATGNGIRLRDSNDLALGTVQSSADLTVDVAGDLVQVKDPAQQIVVGSKALITAGGDVVLSGALNDFKGAVSAQASTIRITDQNNLELGGIYARTNGTDSSGALYATSGGLLTQDATQGQKITVDGKAELTATESIRLNGDNRFQEGVTVSSPVVSIKGDVQGDARLAAAAAAAGTSASASLGMVSALPSVSANLSVAASGATSASASSSSSASNSPSAGASTSGIGVEMVDRPQTSQRGIVAVTLPPDTATAGSGFAFSLPTEVIQKFNQKVAVTLADGAPLPTWLSFNAGTGEFTATAVPDRAFPLQVNLAWGGQELLVVISERQK